MRQVVWFLVAMVACVCASAVQYIPPDVQIALERIDPVSGKTLWKFRFDRRFRPYRCELFTNRVVAFLYPVHEGIGPTNTKVVYLNAKTGKNVEPFDTRSFVYPDDDPLVTRSGHGSQRSIEEERLELSLPNGWRSHGVAGLRWRNVGTNNIHFFDRTELKWTLTLPEGAYDLANWKDVLVFNRTTQNGGFFEDTLHGLHAGNPEPIWKFQLPGDIPDQILKEPFSRERKARSFSYLIGQTNIFAYGGRTLFALHPETGQIQWRYKISENVPGPTFSDGDFGYLVEGTGCVYLIYTRAILPALMARFDIKSKTIVILKEDLYGNPLPIAGNGGVYCFTEKK